MSGWKRYHQSIREESLKKKFKRPQGKAEGHGRSADRKEPWSLPTEALLKNMRCSDRGVSELRQELVSDGRTLSQYCTLCARNG